VFTEFQRLSELLRVYAIAHDAIPQAKSSSLQTITSVTLVPTAVVRSGGQRASVICGVIELKARTFFDPVDLSTSPEPLPRPDPPSAATSSGGVTQWLRDHRDVINATVNIISIGATVAVYAGLVSNPVGIGVHLAVAGAQVAYNYATSGNIDKVDAATSAAVTVLPRAITVPINVYEVATGIPVETMEHEMLGTPKPDRRTPADRLSLGVNVALGGGRAKRLQTDSITVNAIIPPMKPSGPSAPATVGQAMSNGARKRDQLQMMKDFGNKHNVKAKQYRDRQQR
jgi:hypothetical protein